MEQETRQKMPNWADPTALGFIALGVGIFATVPFLTGWVSHESAIAMAPWGIAALITLTIATIISFRNGNLMGGTAFGVLGVVLAGAVAINVVQDMVMVVTGTTVSPSLLAGSLIIDAMAWLALGIVLIFIGFLGGYISRLLAVFVWLATAGVFMTSAADFGLVGQTTANAGGYLVLLLGAWFLYMGVGELINGVLGRHVVPLGKPCFVRKAVPEA